MATNVSTSPPPAPTKVRVKTVSQSYGRVAPGSEAEDELVKQSLPLVRQVVGRLAMNLPAHVDMDDLYSSGLVGLLNAVRQFDPNGGSTFESYARVRIRGAVFDELRRLDWVPRSVHDKARKVQTVMQQLEQQNGEPASDEQMAHALKLSVSEYHDLLDEIRPATFVCLDATPALEDDDDTSRHDRIADDSQPDPVDATARREVAAIIAARITRLPEMQRKVLALYYFEDLRLREIAEAFGVTESRICQIHSQAILAIRAFLKQQEATEAQTHNSLTAA
ncbi:MAG: FliA/WhiG family RNA polymerase sigma factor [Verrucomicrobiota bacterium]|jgi:RNA polymerase sigma factor FliA